MYKLYQIILVTKVVIISYLILNSEANDSGLVRTKRYLAFSNITRMYLKINWKANMVPWNQIFTQSFGFRLAWDDPPSNFHYHHHLHRRDLYRNLEIVLEKSGLHGFHCVRRAICEVNSIEEPDGVYHNILKIIFKKRKSVSRWHDTNESECDQSISTCPLSILQASTYTDL